MRFLKNLMAIVIGLTAGVAVYCLEYFVISFLGSIPILGALIYYPSDASWVLTALPPTSFAFVAATVGAKIAKSSKPVSAVVIAVWVFNIICIFIYNEFVWNEFISSLFGAGTGLVCFSMFEDAEDETESGKRATIITIVVSAVIVALFTGLLIGNKASSKETMQAEKESLSVAEIADVIDQSLREQFTGENMGSGWYEVTYQENPQRSITINVWYTGMLDIAKAAAEGEPEYQEAWDEIKEDCVKTCGMYIDAVNSMAEGIIVDFKIKNETNTALSLLWVKNGEAFYDYVAVKNSYRYTKDAVYTEPKPKASAYKTHRATEYKKAMDEYGKEISKARAEGEKIRQSEQYQNAIKGTSQINIQSDIFEKPVEEVKEAIARAIVNINPSAWLREASSGPYANAGEEFIANVKSGGN